eukprot:4999750-Heterocapsa_arctica.AAC.1
MAESPSLRALSLTAGLCATIHQVSLAQTKLASSSAPNTWTMPPGPIGAKRMSPGKSSQVFSPCSPSQSCPGRRYRLARVGHLLAKVSQARAMSSSRRLAMSMASSLLL